VLASLRGHRTALLLAPRKDNEACGSTLVSHFATHRPAPFGSKAFRHGVPGAVPSRCDPEARRPSRANERHNAAGVLLPRVRVAVLRIMAPSAVRHMPTNGTQP